MDTEAKEFQERWNRLSTQGKKALVRRAERKGERAQARAQLRAAPAAAFICPRCFKSFPTADERNACKAAHRSAA